MPSARPGQTTARRSSSALTSTRCRRRGRSSPWSATTASCGTPAGRSSAQTTSQRSSQMIEAARRIVEEGRSHAGVELLFTPKEEVGLLGAGAFDHTTLEARARLRLRPGGSDRGRDHGCAVPALDAGPLPRPAGTRRNGAGGRAFRHLRPRPARSPIFGSDGRPADHRERRPDRRRHRAQHRPRVVRAPGRSRSHEPAARRTRRGDARRLGFCREPRRVHARNRDQRDVPGLPLQGRRPDRRSSRGRRSSAAATSSCRP